MTQPRKPRTRQPTGVAAPAATEHGPATRNSLRNAILQRPHLLSTFRLLAAGDPPVERVVARALELVHSSLHAPHCAYATRGADGGNFRLVAGIGWTPGVIGRDALSDAPGSLAAHTVLVGRAVIVEDLHRVGTFAPESVLLDHQVRSSLTVPVRGQRGSMALLGAFSSTRRLFTPDEADFLWGLAQVINAALYRVEWRNHMPVHRSSPSPSMAAGRA